MKTIYTIGYEGTDISKFIETLQVVGIEVLADVRALPLSRKKGFSKNSLREHLEAVGIEYHSYQTLGDPKPGRDAARAGKYDVFRKIYTEHIETAAAEDRISELAQTSSNKVTCMLCFERDPKTCHRSIIAEKLVGHGISHFDLYGDDPVKYERNRHLLPTFQLEAAE
ncbi:DUF488 family protein [Pseudochrobactrum sp. XF203]|uniref:DUF488 domain-containing protein n=1 Tax=Pseudochrobactrum sp. XF203 TaxID=2879116 RepID=UPI001CE3641F|nr:DUF488 domain-containing protein [Pseudochrobactrum sp. XF203]UCA47618.1 DUF488 domain-containing protein [Pseudochrobactrum sp. XF203]